MACEVLHCVELGKGGRNKKGGISEYARMVGKNKDTVFQYYKAAEVLESLENVDTCRHLIDKARHLYEISKAPDVVWGVICQHLTITSYARAIFIF